MKKPLLPKVRKFPAGKQRRLDQLLDKNSDGNITPGEAATLAQLVAEAEELMVANAASLIVRGVSDANDPRNQS